jgi:hypothetical protein
MTVLLEGGGRSTTIFGAVNAALVIHGLDKDSPDFATPIWGRGVWTGGHRPMRQNL